MKFSGIKKILLGVSAVLSVVFFFFSLSSLYMENDVINSAFHTPWFHWQVDAAAVYFLTAMLCLVTTRLGLAVFHKNRKDDYKALIEG